MGGKSRKFCCNFINDRYCVSVIWHSSKVHLFSTNSFTLSHINSFIYANFHDLFSHPNQEKTGFFFFRTIASKSLLCIIHQFILNSIIFFAFHLSLNPSIKSFIRPFLMTLSSMPMMTISDFWFILAFSLWLVITSFISSLVHPFVCLFVC